MSLSNMINTCVLSVIMCAVAAGQAPPRNTGSQDPVTVQEGEQTQIWTGNLAYEPVGSGDLVYISVAGAPEISGSYRVSAEGELSLPLLSRGIPVAGLYPAKVAASVATELTSERVFVEPIVSVAVLDYRSRLLSVMGAVRAPATLQALGGMRLLDALAKAQGLTPEAGPEIIVTRPLAANKGRETLRIPVKELLSGADPALNLELHGGEEIRVPEAPKIFVVGNVKTPGPYPLHDEGNSTVLKALALSQGTLAFTARTAYVYRLQPGSKNRKEIAVPLHKILQRRAPDFQLEANDILYIPENSKMGLSASILEHLAGFGSATASGLVIWH
jgi:polysaccharide biosynthesis/export protein